MIATHIDVVRTLESLRDGCRVREYERVALDSAITAIEAMRAGAKTTRKAPAARKSASPWRGFGTAASRRSEPALRGKGG